MKRPEEAHVGRLAMTLHATLKYLQKIPPRSTEAGAQTDVPFFLPDPGTASEAGVVVPIEDNLSRLLAQEDTDEDGKITIEDTGPRRFDVVAADGMRLLVQGTYPLSNLLQELALAREEGKCFMFLQPSRLFENPVDRLTRMIRDHFWDGLTRRIDASGLNEITWDPKMEESQVRRLYVPFDDREAHAYYLRLAREHPSLRLKVTRLPEEITPAYVRSLDDASGLLSLALEKDEHGTLQAKPFLVPGGRFNEMYGWDSYFIALGLLQDGRTDLARALADQSVYQIEHYGQILNANRTYYLTRSQPPFLTSLGLAIFEKLPAGRDSDLWLKDIFRAAIREYRSVWLNEDRLTPTGLSRYFCSGTGMPPETEPAHFDGILASFAQRAGMSLEDYTEGYRSGAISEPALDRFFVHDRAMRESGHDTSYRLLAHAADLNTVDLNALLYRYEYDIASTIQERFDDALLMPDGTVERSAEWFARAEARRQSMNDLMWNREAGMFFDFDYVTNQRLDFVSAAALYPLWAGMATQEQADLFVAKALPLLKAPGGLLGSTEASRGPLCIKREGRQWDYPYGWAPHQMMAWEGLRRYGYHEEARELAYRWLHTIVRNAADYNGTVPEKYDVVDSTHHVFVEYGNVGTDFTHITREGFGWMNASFQVGLTLLSDEQHEELRRLTDPDALFRIAC